MKDIKISRTNLRQISILEWTSKAEADLFAMCVLGEVPGMSDKTHPSSTNALPFFSPLLNSEWVPKWIHASGA